MSRKQTVDDEKGENRTLMDVAWQEYINCKPDDGYA